MQDGTDPVSSDASGLTVRALTSALTAHGLHTQMIIERTEQTINWNAAPCNSRTDVWLLVRPVSHECITPCPPLPPHYCGPLSSRRTFKYAAWLAPLAQGTIHDPTGPFGQSTHSQSIHGVAPPESHFAPALRIGRELLRTQRQRRAYDVGVRLSLSCQTLSSCAALPELLTTETIVGCALAVALEAAFFLRTKM